MGEMSECHFLLKPRS